MEIKAFKMDGLGNDFVIIDRRKNPISINKEKIIIIDHHKSACDKFQTDLNGYIVQMVESPNIELTFRARLDYQDDMHRFKFTPDDLFINRLKTYPEYNVFIYQSRMHVNNETQPSTADGLVVYDINRNKTSTNAIYPFVMSGSEKNAFKAQQYQPIIKEATGEHFNIRKYY